MQETCYETTFLVQSETIRRTDVPYEPGMDRYDSSVSISLVITLSLNSIVGRGEGLARGCYPSGGRDGPGVPDDGTVSSTTPDVVRRSCARTNDALAKCIYLSDELRGKPPRIS